MPDIFLQVGGQCRATAFARPLSILALTVCMPQTASAQETLETLISAGAESDADGRTVIDLRFLNAGHAAVTLPLPERIEAQIVEGDRKKWVWLERSPGTPAQIVVEPGSFGRGGYRLPPGNLPENSLFSIPGWSNQQLALRSLRASDAQAAESAPAKLAGETSRPEPSRATAADRAVGNSFAANLAPYEPIYAVYGPGSNTEARIQLSFEYHLFGSHQDAKLPQSWRGGLHFAYTQRMFWDLSANSKPFRNIDYQPEVIYITPSRVLDNGISLAAQGGLRHESNGRDGAASRSINSFYIAPMASVPLGGDRRLLLSPRVSFYLGDKSDNPDIVHYRGNAGLFLQVGDDDGLRLSTTTRFNFASGKGSVNGELSYPLPGLLGGGPDVYLFVQGFVGYGENLLDYNRSKTRLRAGFALVR